MFWACTDDSKEDLGGNGNNCDTENVSFASDVQVIFNASCTFSVCHDASTPSAGINLTSYEGIDAVSTTLLLNAIKHEGNADPMPRGAAKLSDCKIATIEAWINDGKPNN